MASGVRWTKKDRSVLQRLIRETPGEADALLRAAATEIVSDVVLGFPAVSPSPVGGPPGIDTGTLMGSIRWTPDGFLRIVVHDGTEYGVLLELGTERMGARPFIAPVFDEWNKGKFRQLAVERGILK